MGEQDGRPSMEDVLELVVSGTGIEVLHPGGYELSRRIGQIADLKGKEVLDVACGRGAFACHYAKHFGSKVTGVDLSPDMIEDCSRRAAAESQRGSCRTCR